MLMYPKVLSEFDTIALLRQGWSIARYGDGELKIARGGAAVSQDPDETLSRRLKEILVMDNPNCLVAIPNVMNLPRQKQAFWAKYGQPPWTSYYQKSRTYGSSFITRPDNAPSIDCDEFYHLVKGIWADRRVVLVNNPTERKFDGHPTFLDNAASVIRWNCPGKNAWAFYHDLMAEAIKQPKDTLFILAMGAAATVVAWDLSKLGYQALDLGHMGMFYRRRQEAK